MNNKIINTKISVIIPVYNGQAYLKNCIKSILNQKLKEIEVIIVNDGSIDGSKEIIEKYCLKDERIKAIHKKNEGVSEARNTALKVAVGEYIAFVDVDDDIHPNMFNSMYSCAKQQNADIVMCGYNEFNFNGEVEMKSPPIEINKLIMGKEKEEIITTKCSELKAIWFVWRNIYKNEVVRDIKFNKDINLGEDGLFNLEAFYKSKNIYAIKDFFYNYRHYEYSGTQGQYRDDMLGELEKQYFAKVKFYNQYKIYDKAKKDLHLYVLTLIIPKLVGNIYNYNNDNKREELIKILQSQMAKNSKKEVSLIDVIQSNNIRGVKLLSVLIKLNFINLLHLYLGR